MSASLEIVRALPFFGVEHGGPIAQAKLVDQELVARGHQVTRVASALGQPDDVPQDRFFEHQGVRCFFASARGAACAPPYPVPRAAHAALRDAMQTADVATCNVGLSLWARAVSRAATAARVPWVYNVEGALDPHRLTVKRLRKRAFIMLFERPALRSAAALQAVTPTEANALAAAGAPSERIHVVPNGVALQRAASAEMRAAGRRALGVPDGASLVLFFGRVNDMKGVSLLLEGCARAMTSRDALHLAVVGPDEGAAGPLRVRADQLGVADRLHIHGRVDAVEDRAAIYAAADLFALPSQSEGLPNAALEAAAAGLPLLVTPGCNLPEVDRYEAGWTCSQSAESVSAAVAEQHDDPRRRRARAANAHRMAAERFSLESVVDRLEALYRQLAGAKRS